jgi:hypothetical protein
MRRIISLVVMALVMAAMMLAMALPAFGAPNPNSAAGECGPPGQTHNDFAKVPGESTPETFGGPPGAVGVTQECAPGTRVEEPPEEPI